MKHPLFTLLRVTTFVAMHGKVSSQTVRWGDAPRFKEKPYNIFVDTSTNQRYSKTVIDSIYHSRKNALQIIDNIAVGDAMLWLFRFYPDNGFAGTLWETVVTLIGLVKNFRLRI